MGHYAMMRMHTHMPDVTRAPSSTERLNVESFGRNTSDIDEITLHNAQ